MRYFIDTEFLDTGRTIDLVSIGIVSSDGREYYAQSVEFDANKASDWVWENVLDHLAMCPCCGNWINHEYGKCRHLQCAWRTRKQIRDEIKAFCDPEQYGKPELLGRYCGYDWVVLCQVFGTMMDIPAGWPHYIKDFQQILDDRGITDDELPEQEEGLHNALADARHIKKLWSYIVRNDCWQ